MDYEQLGHILESIHPGVTIADSSGVFRFVSNSYLSGRSVKGSDIIGKFAGSEEMMKMFSPCVTQMVFESHKRVTTVQKGVDNEETFVTGIPVFKDGELEMIISYSSWEITGFDDLRERYNVLQYQNKKLLDEIELMTGRDGGQRYIAQSSRSRDARRLAGVFCVTQAVRVTSMVPQEAAKAILLPLYTAKKERFTPMTAHLSGKKS